MTQIRHLSQPVSRRPGELGVHSLDRFNFSVPDLAAARTFYSSFGLDVREEGGALNIHTHGHPHRWGAVVEGPKKKLQFISFGAFEDDLPRFRQRLDALHIPRIDPPKVSVSIAPPDAGISSAARLASSRAFRVPAALPARQPAAPSRSCSPGGSPICWCSPGTSRRRSSFTATF